ncbi:MAG: anthranilate synthase component I [Candidatus Bathyarchaeota archaeon]|jgi:anthranilate synthase component 1|nr:anthranilate synthase component I [Candidatus Bathyarchaeota archaeon]
MIEEFPYDASPVSIFEKLENCKYAYLLESVEGPERLAKFSFVGFNPHTIISAKDQKVRTLNIASGEERVQETNDPLDIIRKEVKKNHVHLDLFRLTGGAVGYISYDTVRYLEKLPEITLDDQEFPDIEMALFDDGLVFDHINREAYYYSQTASRLKEIEDLVQKAAADQEPLRYTPPTSNPSKEEFKKSVTKAKEYISSGDIFQVVLSKRYSFSFKGSLLPFYRVLRNINPSPYMYFLKMGERQVVGSSPESLVRVERGAVETYPIAGTRPRTDDPVKNQVLAEELLSDPKERAEHVMLVDLARNDVGRIAEFKSVKVPEFMSVQQYSHVQHIVSRVVGKMRSDKDGFDALEAMLPAGTVSGAPKVRAMEIIEELELTRRGPYAGAVGYFSYNGNADFAITIRTLTTNRNTASIQVGGGIVADSDPEKEWFETEYKSAALMKALAQAGEEI